MTLEEIEKRIKKTKRLNKRDRLWELRDIAEEIGNHFTESMSILEMEIENVLDNTSEKIKDELEYHSLEDVTRDINVRSSFDY